MGVVYLATAGNGSPVAVKVLRPELSGDTEFRTRFSREVAALTRVKGVCTVRVIEADTNSARPYLVTEYVEGPSLSEYIESRGPMEPRMLYGLATGLAEALTAIHAAGIVHRDLKPSNVLLTTGGPKVIDFGIAQVLEATAVTKAGFTVGSAGFMAPEQIMGRAASAADLFSWAVTIAYAASGRSPFGTGTTEAILYRILHDTPDLAGVPGSLLPQITAALAKEPQARPTAPELLSQLTRPAVQPSAGYDNPTQTILAQTWLTPASRPQVPATPPQARATPPQVPATPPQARATPPQARATPSYVPAVPPQARDAPPEVQRSGPRRPVLFAIVLAVAILVGAGGAALAFALAGHHATNPGTGSSHSQTAPPTPTVTNSSASAPTSPSSATPSQNTSAPASSSPNSPSTSSAPSTPSTSSTPSSLGASSSSTVPSSSVSSPG